ncbi:MAG: protein phosphatase 2C domain-containing protein [bacterium]
MEIVIAGATDCGTVRKTNEDFFYYSLKQRLVVVCDGMGGHQSGAVASRIAGETMRDIFFYSDLAELRFFCSDQQERMPEIALRLLAGARLANRRLFIMAEQDPGMRGMGTTLVAMAFNDTTACAVHVGDSRAYQLKQKALQQLTDDHSWVNELLQDHEIRAEEVQHFSKKNVLTRALGTHAATKIDLQWFPLNGAEKFLLCTDGLHNALVPEAILQNLQSSNEAALVQDAERLVQRAKQANGSDNITAALALVKPTRAITVRSKHVKMTIAEEPEPLLTAEERFIKRQYFGVSEKKTPPSPARRMAVRVFPMAATVVALAALGYFLNPFGDTVEQETTEPSPQSTAASLPQTAVQAQQETLLLAPAPNDEIAADSGESVPATPASADSARMTPLAFDSVATIAGQNPPAGAAMQEEAQPETLSRVEHEPPAAVPETAAQDSLSPNAGTMADPAPVPMNENVDPAPESLVPQSGGRIFLPGLDGASYGGAEIFVNDLQVGPVRPLAETGFLLPPGVYTIAVKDSAGQILHQKTNVSVSKGDVKTLEF